MPSSVGKSRQWKNTKSTAVDSGSLFKVPYLILKSLYISEFLRDTQNISEILIRYQNKILSSAILSKNFMF